MFIYGIVISFINAIIANKKGYSPVLWFFANSPLAFIIIIFKSNSNLEEDQEERESMIKTSNREAVWLIVLGVIVTSLQILFNYGIGQY
ncbi:MAG: hypothetical protein K9N06_11340 [Candidatus Cloacimonetes bacterium]|nr:hypothetical protein [Candidatus Cloacimonadota bacterium]